MQRKSTLEKLLIIICVDMDQDRPEFGGQSYSYFGEQVWQGIARGVPSFMKRKSEFTRDSDCDDFNITWFFRSDLQLNRIYGDAGWSLNRFRDVIEQLLENGDEIGWHAHTWRWSEVCKSWYQENSDQEWIIRCFREGFLGFVRASGFKPSSFRSGWGFHNNLTMSMLEKFGINLDLSALPSIRNLGEKWDKGCLFKGYTDWQKTGHRPYFPSKKDYQVTEKNNYTLLEIPVTTFRKPLISYLHQLLPFRIVPKLQLAKPMLNFSKYHLSITHPPILFKKGVKEMLKRSELDRVVPVVTAFHADDLLNEENVKNILTNIKQIFLYAKNRKITVRFTTASEARKTLLPLVNM